VACPDDPLPYFNSGCWTEFPCHFLTLTDGVVTLNAFVPSAAMADTQIDLPVNATAAG
jgi:hypothetical protein